MPGHRFGTAGESLADLANEFAMPIFVISKHSQIEFTLFRLPTQTIGLMSTKSLDGSGAASFQAVLSKPTPPPNSAR